MDDSGMKHGAFGWFELMTSDVESAKTFYKDLFGWEYETVPIPGSEYTVVKLNGEAVAGIMQMPDELVGMPPSWGIYITVDDVDKTVEEIKAKGGKVLRPGTDIPDVGRFCVLQDKQGAVLMAISYKKK